MHLLHGSIEPLAIVHLQHRRMFALTVQQTNNSNRQPDEATTMAYVNASRAANGSITDRLSAVVAAFKAAVVRRQLFLRTFRELNSLTERELGDLGIHRSMIREISMEAAYGK